MPHPFFVDFFEGSSDHGVSGLEHNETEDLTRLLSVGAESFGIQLRASQIDAFAIYLDLLSSWSHRFNLTSIREPREIVRLHFLDAIAICPSVPEQGRLVDVGAGAGIPGIPIKIVYGQKEVLLVEPRRKRASFLKQVVRSLGLEGITVIEERIEDIDREQMGVVDQTVTRGFGDIPLFLKVSSSLLRRGGLCLLMQGPKGPEVLASFEERLRELKFSTASTRKFSLPFGNEQRFVILCRKA